MRSAASNIHIEHQHYNCRMLLLRFAAVLTLVVWVGGLLALGGVAAPAIFDVAAAQHVSDGRLLVGRHLRRNPSALPPGQLRRRACSCSTLVVGRVLGPRPRRFAWRAALALVMLAASVYSGVVSGASHPQLQQRDRRRAVEPRDDDPRRVEFGRLHGLSTALQLVPLLGGLALIYWEIKE